MKTLVLGIGNLLLTDEGVGVHVVRALQQRSLPRDVTVLEVGTAFLDVISFLEDADRIVLIDAMHGGGSPGSVYRVPFDECLHPETLLSLHGFDISRVLFLAGNQKNPEVLALGIEPEKIEWGIELSPALQRHLPEILTAVIGEIELMAAAA